MPTIESSVAKAVGLPWLTCCVASSEEFVTSFWQKRPGIFRGACSYSGCLTLSKIVQLIERQAISPDRIRLLRDGSRSAIMADPAEAPLIDSRSLRLMLGQGYTLNLSAVEDVLPAVQDLCTGLGQELGQVVTANAYLTPPTSQALPAHLDGHDVIVLQLQGEKDWQVFGKYADQPTAAQTVQPSGMPLLAVTLHEGDSLYIPRGFVHSVTTAAQPSLHLTIALLPRAGAAPGARRRS
jgi:lysine-specific demethylase/histidyl-hydroxylase NO66